MTATALDQKLEELAAYADRNVHASHTMTEWEEAPLPASSVRRCSTCGCQQEIQDKAPWPFNIVSISSNGRLLWPCGQVESGVVEVSRKGKQLMSYWPEGSKAIKVEGFPGGGYLLVKCPVKNELDAGTKVRLEAVVY